MPHRAHSLTVHDVPQLLTPSSTSRFRSLLRLLDEILTILESDTSSTATTAVHIEGTIRNPFGHGILYPHRLPNIDSVGPGLYHPKIPTYSQDNTAEGVRDPYDGARFQDPWSRPPHPYLCAEPQCVLAPGHTGSHELAQQCLQQSCILHTGHGGDHSSSKLLKSSCNSAEYVEDALSPFNLDEKQLKTLVLDAVTISYKPTKSSKASLSPLHVNAQPFNIMMPKDAAISVLRSIRSQVADFHSMPAERVPLQSSPARHRPQRQIRLFKLDPSADSATVTGTFELTQVESPPAYTALSYTWGDHTDQISILMGNRQLMSVGRNLWCFLRQQASVIEAPKLYWIDAICINQANVHERNHQVTLMRRIYQTAMDVYIWLGPASNNSDLAMRYLRKQSKLPLGPKGLGYHPLWSKPEANALRAFCSRPYWRRSWVVQEILHASRLTICCGAATCSWVDLEALYLKLKAIEASNWFAHHYLHMTIFQSPAATMLWQRAHYRHPDTPPPRLSSLIRIFRDWQCTDVRDKVFALVGMAAEEGNVVPDYDMTPRQVYGAVLDAREEDADVADGDGFEYLLSQLLGLRA